MRDDVQQGLSKLLHANETSSFFILRTPVYHATHNAKYQTRGLPNSCACLNQTFE